MLLLENRLSRGAFTADRLDAVMLIAGQLAVSLDNALLYASLERKVAERTEALAAANERLRAAQRHRSADRPGQPPPAGRRARGRVAPGAARPRARWPSR